MTDKMIDLALTYGGFTSLDKVYLDQVLKKLSPEDQLTFITPPPSVINAYFAEIYQKQGAEAATTYYFELSTQLQLFTTQPSFAEEKPFVRLNLSGKSYGFAYTSATQEVALVFGEIAEPINQSLLWELAQVFPHYKIYVDHHQIKMAKLSFEETEAEDITPQTALLSHVTKLKANLVKLSSFNQEELVELLAAYSGRIYYAYDQRQFMAYVQLENT